MEQTKAPSPEQTENERQPMTEEQRLAAIAEWKVKARPMLVEIMGVIEAELRAKEINECLAKVARAAYQGRLTGEAGRKAVQAMRLIEAQIEETEADLHASRQ